MNHNPYGGHMPGRLALSYAGAVGTLILTAACGSTAVDANGAGTLNLQTATSGQPAIAAAERTLDLNGDVLVISSVELVAREIELEGSEGSCEAATSASSDDCNEVEVGPVLLSLPLTPGAAQNFSTVVSAGTFNEVKFRIDTPDDDNSADLAFRASHPEFEHASIRVIGTFNDVPFTFTSDVEAEQEIHLPTPIVTGDAAVDLTIFVDVDGWFMSADGTTLIDPALALPGEPMQALVEGNIKASFQAFEDHDHDGSDDSGHSGTDDSSNN